MCTYVLLAGLPGTGKSTVAEALAARLPPSAILNKDDVRAVLFPGGATDYSDRQNDLCMEAMLSAAAYLRSQKGGPRYIFFDGRTFSRAAHIERVVAAAETEGAGWRILHLTCPDEVAIARIERSNPTHPARDRNAARYAALKAAFEPIVRPCLTLDTALNHGLSVAQAVAYLARDAEADAN